MVQGVRFKNMEPLFPRLHVKDTEKGGPKQPPRNKMAIYEELATPSSRLALGSGVRMSLNSSDDGQMGHVLVGSSCLNLLHKYLNIIFNVFLL